MRRALVLLAFLCGCATASATDRALSRVRLGDDAGAIVILRDRLKDQPEDVPARRLLVRVLAMKSELGAAEIEVQNLRRYLPPNDPIADIELGHAYELAHKFEEALAAYDQAAARAPSSPAGPAEGGMRAAHWGEAEEARPRLEEAIRRGRRDPEIFHAVGLVKLKLGDLAGAEEAYRAGLALDPDTLENELGLATVAVVRSDARAALEAYEHILAKKPRFAAAELGRAWALAKLGRTSEARKAIERAEQLGAPPAIVARQRGALP